MVIFTERFDKDCMSDLLTNILNDLLHEFTIGQMQKYNRKPDGENSFYFWNPEILDWQAQTRPCWKYNGGEFLLVPKTIVRFRYLNSVRSYLMLTIISHYRLENDLIGVPKDEVVKMLERESENWAYEYAIKYSLKYPELLTKYHEESDRRYFNKFLDNDELDYRVYK